MANTTPQGIRPPAQKDETPSAPASQPLAVFKFGSVSAAIFLDEVKTAKGTVTVHNVSLRRSYRDSEDVWHTTHSLRLLDLLPASYALLKCYDAIAGATGLDEERA